MPWNYTENTTGGMVSKIRNARNGKHHITVMSYITRCPYHCWWPKVSLKDLSTMIVKSTQDQTLTVI